MKKKDKIGTIKQHSPLQLLGLITLALLATACTHNEIDLPQQPTGDAVSFRTETSDDFTTRSTGHTTNGITAIRSMGIYAGYTSDAWDDTKVSNNFFNNLDVSRTSDVSSWTYTNEQYWPGSGNLSFFAYAPHSDHDVYDGNKPTITVPTVGIPTINYQIASTHDKQVDLLVATPQLNQVKRDYVTMPLRHALTKIAFSARVENQPATGTDIQITKIVISNLFDKGIIKMDGTNRTWEIDDNSKAAYTQTVTGGGINAVPLTNIYQPLTPPSGHLFLMPQTLAEGKFAEGGATVSVTYTTTVGGTLTETKTFDLTLSDAISKFAPGMAYNMMILINNGVTFIVVPTPWDNTEVQADIKNRILNVSRIEAGVYDGALTRIHFWSNQPKDSVYVFLKGNEDGNNRKPIGAIYTVNDVFQNLSTKAANGGNLYYPTGFNGTTASGEGYIDIYHAPKYYAPENTNNYHHIWLNASGLTRNIRLNSRFSTPTTIPYIGTFHRWNERGERIVKWDAMNGTTPLVGDEETWTATVLDSNSSAIYGGGKDVLIDRLPSPFHANGQLYTSNPGDPEQALVSNQSKSVSGKGRHIYFRVGWNSNSGDNRTIVRYARIEVKNATTGLLLTTLYLRQGEEPDFTMNPTETGTNMDTRPNAMRFSPYNLTAPTLNTTARRTGDNATRFTQYPTQAGAMFQWANIAYANYAYSPVGTVSTWDNTSNNNDLWKNIKNIHETCPPGYRRPISGSIDAKQSSDYVNCEFKQSLIYEIKKEDDQIPIENSQFGFYADGFYDRRVIELNSLVSKDTRDVAYIGRLFYNPNTYASLFFPATGRRANTMIFYNADIYSPTAISSPTNSGMYYSATLSNANGSSKYLYFNNTGISITDYLNYHALTIRCVRDVIFSTELPEYVETGVPTYLAFNATADNSTSPPVFVNDDFIHRWIAVMNRDIIHYKNGTDPDALLNRITAKVTFHGTAATGTHQIETSGISGIVTAVGSTITYDLTRVIPTPWGADISFSFEVHEGWSATVGNTTINGSSPIPNAITINTSTAKVVKFKRTKAPVTP